MRIVRSIAKCCSPLLYWLREEPLRGPTAGGQRSSKRLGSEDAVQVPIHGGRSAQPMGQGNHGDGWDALPASSPSRGAAGLGKFRATGAQKRRPRRNVAECQYADHGSIQERRDGLYAAQLIWIAWRSSRRSHAEECASWDCLSAHLASCCYTRPWKAKSNKRFGVERSTASRRAARQCA